MLQCAIAGLGGGMLSGAILAGLHAAGSGGPGAAVGLIAGGVSGGALGLLLGLLAAIVRAVMVRVRNSGQANAGARAWVITGLVVGALGIAILHILNTTL